MKLSNLACLGNVSFHLTNVTFTDTHLLTFFFLPDTTLCFGRASRDNQNKATTASLLLGSSYALMKLSSVIISLFIIY